MNEKQPNPFKVQVQPFPVIWSLVVLLDETHKLITTEIPSKSTRLLEDSAKAKLN